MMGTAVPPTDVEKAQPEIPAAPVRHPHDVHPVRAMLCKEFNDLVIWFVGLMVPYACIIAWFESIGGNSIFARNFYPERSANAYISSAVACPAIAILIGAYQFLGESSWDTYALLVHRPISRIRIFWLKTFAGLATYLAAVIVPFIGLILWGLSQTERSPDSIPWVLRNIGGAIAMGTIFYFAGTLLATRKSKWFTTLWLPTIWPFFAMLIILSDQKLEWWMRVIYYVIAATPLIFAAQWSFATLGQIRQQPWYARLSLGVLVSAGLGMALTIFYGAVIVATTMIPVEIQSFWAETLLLKDGTVVRGIHDNQVQVRRNRPEWLNYAEEHVSPNALPPVMENLAPTEHLLTIPASRNDSFGKMIFDHEFFRERINSGTSLYSGWLRINNQIYDARDSGSVISLYTFLPSSHPEPLREDRLLGFVGSEGADFGNLLPQHPFDMHVVVLPPAGILTPQAIYLITTEGKLKPVFTPPDGTKFTNRSAFRVSYEVNPVVMDIFLTTPKHLYDIRVKYDKFANEFTFDIRNTIPLERDGALVVMIKKEKIVVLRYDEPNRGEGPSQTPSLLVEYNSDGTVTRREVPAPGWHRNGQWKAAVIAVAPEIIVPVGMHLWQTGERWCRQWYNGIQYPGRDDLRYKWDATKWSTLMGLLAAVAMALILRRQYFGWWQVLLWCVIAFFGGPAALLLRPAIVPSRVMEKCPDCHKKRPVELMECPHCHKPWPAPTRDGREIFA